MYQNADNTIYMLKGGVSVRLNDLELNEKATVTHTGGGLGARLMDMGLVPGTEVQPLMRSPLNDPAAYFFRGTVMAIRNADAAEILVEV